MKCDNMDKMLSTVPGAAVIMIITVVFMPLLVLVRFLRMLTVLFPFWKVLEGAVEIPFPLAGFMFLQLCSTASRPTTIFYYFVPIWFTTFPAWLYPDIQNTLFWPKKGGACCRGEWLSTGILQLPLPRATTPGPPQVTLARSALPPPEPRESFQAAQSHLEDSASPE